MNRSSKFDLLFIKIVWGLSLAALVSTLYESIVSGRHHTQSMELFLDMAFFLTIFLINLFKYLNIRNMIIRSLSLNRALYFAELTVMIIGACISDVRLWLYLVLLILCVVTSLSKGMRKGIRLVYTMIIGHVALRFILTLTVYSDLGFQRYFIDHLLGDLLPYLAYFLFAYISGKIHEDNQQRDADNVSLLKQLEEKYQQLEIAQQEIRYHYDKLRDTNSKLEDTNQKLTNSIAEFYTLQKITQAISSIFDINELLKYVNDIIIGVMGVSYSSILIYDPNAEGFRLHTTNIENRNALAALSDNINHPEFGSILESGKPLIENNSSSEQYAFTSKREVNSFICIPLATKANKFGLVLVEQKYFNAFDHDSVRLLDVIGQQVGIAMENTQLYQKMQELATTDNLTGVYNRLYFTERLKEEFQEARMKNYPLSLVIFDVDHFKRFNDTYGHMFGDKVLKSITEAVKGTLRSCDVFARYGGEEFILLLPRLGSSDAFEKTEEFRKLIASTRVRDNLVEASVTASFGLTIFPECADTEDDLLRTADNALYEAKAAGRNCIMTAGFTSL